jgi:zinc protease
MLQNISAYDLPSDYIADEERIIEGMTLEEHRRLANAYLDSSKMGYLVIGDAATQFEKFKSAGFDEVLLLDKDANKVVAEDIKM